MLDEAVVAGVTERGLFELLRQRLVREVLVAAPAVGTDWSQAVPAGEGWELLSVQQQLTTSAVVAARNPMLRVRDDAGNEAFRVGPAATQAASGTNTYSYLAGFGYTGNSGRAQQGLPNPPAILPAGWTIGTITSSIDAGDQYSAILLVVRQWSIREVLLNVEWIANHAR